MDRAEARARKRFRKIRIGHWYEWRNIVGELSVLRVDSKRLTVGSSAGVEVKGTFFSLHAKTGEPASLCSPAYTHEWNRVDGPLRKWKGKKPKFSPMHVKYFCDLCYEGYDDADVECCDGKPRPRRIICGEHDDSCICEDCKPL